MPTVDRTFAVSSIAEAAEFFDAFWYRQTYPDIGEMDPWQHFTSHGDAERRSPGPRLNAEFYASTYLALEDGNALLHYLTLGRAAGYLPQPMTRTADESRADMTAAVAALDHPFLLVGNDAQRAGAPLLLLELSRHLLRRGWSPVFLLSRGGPLLSQFRSVGPTFIAAEGHDISGLGAAFEPETPVLGNTGWAAPLLDTLNLQGPSVLLIHEMPDYLAEQDLLGDVAKARMVVTAFPTVTEGLVQHLPASTPVQTVMPGLLHATGSPGSTARIAQTITETFGADRVIVVGAGFADHRKGFDRFLDTASRMFELDPRCAFIWLGELGAWGQDRAAEARARGLPLLLPGFRPDASAWYSNAHVYLLTSRQDPGPTTTMDAARCGVPFIAAPGDLGIRSLESRLAGVGWFVDDEVELPQRALDIAHTQTPQSRSERSEYIETLASFGRYASDLLDVLRFEGLVDEPLAT